MKSPMRGHSHVHTHPHTRTQAGRIDVKYISRASSMFFFSKTRVGPKHARRRHGSILFKAQRRHRGHTHADAHKHGAIRVFVSVRVCVGVLAGGGSFRAHTKSRHLPSPDAPPALFAVALFSFCPRNTSVRGRGGYGGGGERGRGTAVRGSLHASPLREWGGEA